MSGPALFLALDALKGGTAGVALAFSPTAVRNTAKNVDMAARGKSKDTKGY